MFRIGRSRCVRIRRSIASGIAEVLVEEAVQSHIIAVHHQSVCRGVHVPSHTASDAMIGSPNPEMVTNDVVTVDDNCLIHIDMSASEASYAEEKVGQQSRVVCVANFCVCFRANLHQRVRGIVCIEHQRCDGNAINVVHQYCRLATLARNNRCYAEAK